MQPRPKPAKQEQPPSPPFVLLTSLFGYPGAGHLMVGAKKWAAFFALTFTLGTVAAISEVAYLIPELAKMYQGEAATITRYPNLPRLTVWLLLTSVAWAASGVHSGVLAQKLARNFPASPPKTSESQSSTSETSAPEGPQVSGPES